MTGRRGEQGFALPTVVLASMLVFMVLSVALTTLSGTRAALDQQYFSQLTREGSEAGTAFAQACLAANGYQATWTNAKPLTPSTDCTGTVRAACTTACYVYADASIRISFSVSTPTITPDGYQVVQSTGTVSKLRMSNGAVWNTDSQLLYAKVGASVSAQSIVLGYSVDAPAGSYYGVISADGVLKTAGLNAYGQLGQGIPAGSTVTTPGVFLTPGSTSPIVKGFANNLSIGTSLFAVNADGEAYAAGQNNYGQLGVGSAYTGNVTTPALVQIPGKQISTIATRGDTNGSSPAASYFITTDGYVYSAGKCDGNAMLGYSCAANQWTPKIISGLPTPNINDPNTLPSDNIVVDRNTTYVRMQGGRIYGWGVGDLGQLGTVARTNSTTPIQIGTYGDAGQPKASYIQFDGSTLYVLDDSARLTSVGYNRFGEMGTRDTMIYMSNTNGRCIGNNGTAPALQTCTGVTAQQMTIRADGTISNNYDGECLTVNADNTLLSYTNCNSGLASQQWVYKPYERWIKNPGLNKCLENTNSDGANLQVSVCSSASAAQVFDLYNPTPQPFNTEGIYSGISMISADWFSVSALSMGGEVWSAGRNDTGMFGDGTTSPFHPDPGKFDLSAFGSPRISYVANSAGGSLNNVQVIATDGRVYGAGSNGYGQLGNCTTSTQSAVPVQMKLLVPLSSSYTPCTVNSYAVEDLNPVQVTSGGGTTIVRMSTNRVFSVGNNSSGQLGDGTTTNSSEPQARQFLNVVKPLVY